MFNPLNFLSKIIKSSNQKELDKLKKTVKKINDLEKEIIKLEDTIFPQKTKELIEQVKNGTSQSYVDIYHGKISQKIIY